jgi:glycosyltransferase involved in cell wall biosynthesis
MTPEEVNLLSELTIVIPTYNRPLELERAIEYWRDLPVTVHILDGSDKPWFPVGVLPVASKVFYHHFPQIVDEDWKDNYIRRIKLAPELCSSSFAALCSDDDFFTVEGLKVALKSLRDDVCDVVLGKSAQYLFRDGKFEWKRVNFTWRSDDASLSKDLGVRYGGTRKGSTYYGIFKSQYWKELRLSSVEEKFSNIGAIENIADYLSKVLCRLLVIQEYLWVTNYPDKTYKNSPHKVEKFSSWLHDEKNKHEVEKFIHVLETGLKKFINPSLNVDIKNIAGEILIKKGKPAKLKPVIKVRVLVNKKLLFFISRLPFAVRSRVFDLLPTRWKKVLRTPDFVDSRTPVMEIDADDLSIRRSIIIWELIMLKPREELRLRANI